MMNFKNVQISIWMSDERIKNKTSNPASLKAGENYSIKVCTSME